MNKLKKRRLILLSIISVTVIFLTGCSNQTLSPIATTSPTNSSSLETTEPTNAPTQSSTLHTSTNASTNWKKYTEAREVKFSIEYPSTWTVKTADGMYGEKGATFESGKEEIGIVSIGWNSQPYTENCTATDQKKELIQIKGRKIEMCHYLGSTQQPEQYTYTSSKNGISYVISASNYPGDQNRKTILSVLATLEI